MNKLVKLVAGFVAFAFSASAIAANFDFEPKFYVGANANYAKLNYKENVFTSEDDKVPGFGAFAGVNFNQYVGVEAGYEWFKNAENKSGNDDRTVKLRNVYADVNGYFPVAEKVELIGSVGAGNFKARVKETNVEDSKLGLRVGGGVKYNFTDEIGARALVRWQKAENENVLKNAASVNLGLTYTF